MPSGSLPTAPAPQESSSSKSKSFKKYQPRIAKAQPQLPAVEAFQLDSIVGGPLKEEAHQVVTQLLNVTSNFQNDLRLEIRHKLSIEQRIQFKNIEIAKLANSLNKSISHKHKKLVRALTSTSVALEGSHEPPNMIDSEINDLLRSSVDVSERITRIASSLAKIDKIVNLPLDQLGNSRAESKNKYPHVYRIVRRTDPSSYFADEDEDISPTNEINIVEDYTNNSRIMNDDEDEEEDADIDEDEEDAYEDEDEDMDNDVINRPVLVMLPDPLGVIPKGVATHPESAFVMLPLPELPRSVQHREHTNNIKNANYNIDNRKNGDKYISINKNIDGNNISNNNNDANKINNDNDSQEMDLEQFELFMSNSISKYRELQDKKFSGSDPFSAKGKTGSTSEAMDGSGMLTLENDDSRNMNSLPFHVTSNPINLLYSSLLSNPNYLEATPLQESPFSSILSVKSPATIKLTLQTSHFKKLRINGSPITSDSFKKNKTDNCECTHVAEGGMSPSRRILTESLLDNLRLSSDDEIWYSSGLNTETEEDDEEEEEEDSDAVSSDTSDSDSSEEESNANITSIASTNKYYHTLKSELKKKKKKLRDKGTLRHRRSRRRTRSFQSKDFSPTPKHKPSHHILKPKRSILKTTVHSIKSSAANDAAVKKNAAFTTENFDKKYSNGRSALSAINKAYDSKSKNLVSDFSVSGTIISVASPTSPIAQEAEEEQQFDHNYEYEGAEVVAWNGHNNGTHSPEDNSDVHSIRLISLLKNYIH